MFAYCVSHVAIEYRILLSWDYVSEEMHFRLSSTLSHVERSVCLWLYWERQTGANKHTRLSAPRALLYTTEDVQIYHDPHQIYLPSLCSGSCTNTWSLRCQKNKHNHSRLGLESKMASGHAGQQRCQPECLNIFFCQISQQDFDKVCALWQDLMTRYFLLNTYYVYWAVSWSLSVFLHKPVSQSASELLLISSQFNQQVSR